MAYGAAKFNPSGKHELSVPTTFLSKKCFTYHPTEFVDEYRTSITCSKCRGPLDKCIRAENNIYREIRGLKWCTTKCFRPLNRDKNAAQNIFDAYTLPVRPKQLCREAVKPSVRKKYLRVDPLNSILSKVTASTTVFQKGQFVVLGRA